MGQSVDNSVHKTWIYDPQAIAEGEAVNLTQIILECKSWDGILELSTITGQ